MNNTYVYQHLRSDNNEVFYIGIGNQKRLTKKTGRNQYWKNIVNKHGYNIEVLHENISWDLACEIEMYLISYYGRKDLELGNLVNMTDGEEGSLNRKFNHSNITKEKLRQCNLGKKLSDETKLKMSLSGKKKIFTDTHRENLSNVAKSRVLTEEQLFRLRTNSLGKIMSENEKIKRSKRIINLETNEIYDSVKILANKFNLNWKYLQKRLSGHAINNTPYIYYTN